jgi:hypothetical protein
MKFVGILGVFARRIETSVFPSVKERIESRTSDFPLISLRPYLSFDTNGRQVVDFNKPYSFYAELKTVTEENVTNPKWLKESYSCADDIAMLASIIPRNMEVVAAGSVDTVHAALLEASRLKEAETAKYIVFRYLIQKQKGFNAIVLENLVAPSDSNIVIAVTLDRALPERQIAVLPLALA